MKKYLYMITPLVLFILAGILAFNDKSGWGWFLFIGFILSSDRCDDY